MDVVEQTLSIVDDSNVVLGRQLPPTLPHPSGFYSTSQLNGMCGVLHLGVVAGLLHHVVLGEALEWGGGGGGDAAPPSSSPRLQRIKDDPVWKYARSHFDVGRGDRPVVSHNKTVKHHSVFNLRVLDLVMTCVQDTPSAPTFILQAGTSPVEALLPVITHRWVTPGMVARMGVVVAGQAVAHAVMKSTQEASYVDMWAPDVQHLQQLLRHWRECFKEAMYVGLARDKHTLVVVRPGVKCVVRARVICDGEEAVVSALCGLQPDFTQCMYRYDDGGMVVHATPRALLAIKTKTSMANQVSYTSWLAEDTGLSVSGVSGEVSKESKPCGMEVGMGEDARVWNMMSQHMCAVLSHHGGGGVERDAMYVDKLVSLSSDGGVPMLTFVEHPHTSLSVSRDLYVDVSRLSVEGMEEGGRVVHVSVTADPGNPVVELMERLCVCMNTVYPGSYIRKHKHLRVKVVGVVVHAASGGELARVPWGCSIGGRVEWNCFSTTRDEADNTHELLFKIRHTRVYPTHLPLFC